MAQDCGGYMVRLRRLYGKIAKKQFLGRTLCRGPTKIGQAGNNISVVQTVWRGRRICTVSHGEHWSVEAVELILHELRPKWRLRRLHGVCGGYMSTLRKQLLGRTLYRGPTKIATNIRNQICRTQGLLGVFFGWTTWEHWEYNEIVREHMRTSEII